MTWHEKSRPPVSQTGRAATREHHGDGLTSIVPRASDIREHRRRRAVRRGCRLAEQHLRAYGLWGRLSARVLADIERGEAS